MGLGAISGIAGGIESIFGGIDKANAATSAAQVQANAAQQGATLLGSTQAQAQGNQQPFVNGGQTSLGTLLSGISSGTFGTPGTAPQYQGGDFTAPTAAQAAATPGFQFTQQQGSKGVLQGAAAAGGAIGGGTLRALDQYNSGLASTTYNNTFNQSLSAYNAGLQKYQAQLQGFGAQQGANQQAFGQLFQPAALGEQAANSLNATSLTNAADRASEYNNAGNATAAGIVGSTNNLWGGIQSGTSQILGGGRGQGGQGGQGYGSYGSIMGGNSGEGPMMPWTPTGTLQGAGQGSGEGPG